MYNPKIWYDGDIVTSGGLNNIEQGIAQNAHDIEDMGDDIETAKGNVVADMDSALTSKSANILVTNNDSDYGDGGVCVFDVLLLSDVYDFSVNIS